MDIEKRFRRFRIVSYFWAVGMTMVMAGQFYILSLQNHNVNMLLDFLNVQARQIELLTRNQHWHYKPPKRDLYKPRKENKRERSAGNAI